MIYYDISDILEYARSHDTLTGIQRVSVQLIRDMCNAHGTENIRLIAYHRLLKRVVTFDADFLAGLDSFEQRRFCEHFGLVRDLDDYLAERYHGGPALRRYHALRLLISNTLNGGRTFEKRKISRYRIPHKAKASDPEFAAGDMIFMIGATWNFDAYFAQLQAWHSTKGIRIFQFIHDLIPLVRPQYVMEGVSEHFERWLKDLTGFVDRFITNSQSTKCDLDHWLESNGTPVPTRVVTLAHQFVDRPRAFNGEGLAPQAVRSSIESIANAPYVLCVGTLEPRKNNLALAQAWQQVLKKCGAMTPKLVFAGKRGWANQNFSDFIEGSASLNGSICIVENPTDDELAHLYRRCLFSVYPSFYEGWGLPIGESLWFGKPTIASNTSSMPEVGGDLVDYVDPQSLSSIETAVLRMIQDDDYRNRRAEQIAAAQLRSWSDFAEDFWCALHDDEVKRGPEPADATQSVR